MLNKLTAPSASKNYIANVFMLGYILKILVNINYTFALMYKAPTTNITQISIDIDMPAHNFSPIGTGFNVGFLSSI